MFDHSGWAPRSRFRDRGWQAGGVSTVVRPAGVHDAEAAAWIYNAGIDARTETFETEPRTETDMLERITHSRLPFLVAEVAGEVVGWAKLEPYSARACYAGVAEFSLYVAPEAQRQGIGRALLSELVAAAERQHLHKVTSRVFVENEASRRLCADVGFREVGVHLRHARLDGVWRDCVTVERLIGEAAADDRVS
jgi:L-amino acid N-acyltransferase YncA